MSVHMNLNVELEGWLAWSSMLASRKDYEAAGNI